MLLDVKSKWFRAYCRAVLEEKPDTACAYIDDAILEIEERKRVPALNESEREALEVAARYLNLIRQVELPKAS